MMSDLLLLLLFYFDQYQMMSNYERVKLKSNEMRLFEYSMIVGLQLSDPADMHSYIPVIRFCFPTKVWAA